RTHADECPLLGVNRTSLQVTSMSAFDPKRTSTVSVDTLSLSTVNSGRSAQQIKERPRSRPGPLSPLACRSFGTCGKLGQLGTSQDFLLSVTFRAAGDGASFAF